MGGTWSSISNSNSTTNLDTSSNTQICYRLMHACPKCEWNGRGQALEFTRVRVNIVSSSNEYGINYAAGVHESKSELQEDENCTISTGSHATRDNETY